MKPLLFALLFLMPTNAIADMVDVLDDVEETIETWRTKKESEIDPLCFKLAAGIPRYARNIMNGDEVGVLSSMTPLLPREDEYIAHEMLGAAREMYRRIRSLPHAHEAAREKCKKLLTEKLDGLSWY